MQTALDLGAPTGPIRRLFPYYGGKWRLIRGLYPRPAHDLIVEPFAGSAAYALHYPERSVILHDVDEHIGTVWRYLIAADPDEIRALPILAAGDHVDDFDLSPGARALVGYWLNPGMTAPCKTPSAWSRQHAHEHPGSAWTAATRDRIALDVPRIRHWQFNPTPHTAAGDHVATWYVDPPYQIAGTRYRHGSDGIDFAELGEWCKDRRGQIIVCENAGADWLPFRPLRDVKTARANRSAEVIWP